VNAIKIVKFVFKLVMSARLILPFAVIAAFCAEFFVTHPAVHSGFTGYPHPGTIIVSTVTAMITCALFFAVERDDYAGDFMISVFTRVAVVGVSWPFLRLALHQASIVEAVPFAICSVALFVAGVVGIVGIVRSSRLAGLLLYGTAAFVFLLFVVFLSGKRVLSFERTDGTVHCTLETYRWLGLRRHDVRELKNVTDYKDRRQSDRIGDMAGDGTVLVSANGDVLLIADGRMSYNGLSPQIFDELRDFLESEEPLLRLTEGTPATPWPLNLLIAVGIFYFGVQYDPHVRPPEQETDRRITTTAGCLFGILAAGCLLFGTVYVLTLNWKQSAALSRLQNSEFEVDVRDFDIHGRTINTDGWYVRISNKEFNDDDLQAIVPDLDRAPVLWLDLSGTRVTDEGVNRLRPIGYLPILQLNGTQITSECLSSLRYLSVHHLAVRGTALRATDLNPDKLYMLESLEFTDPGFTIPDIPKLMALRRLKHVIVESLSLTTEELRAHTENTKHSFQLEVISAEAPSADP